LLLQFLDGHGNGAGNVSRCELWNRSRVQYDNVIFSDSPFFVFPLDGCIPVLADSDKSRRVEEASD
jgi:hypothetical protein